MTDTDDSNAAETTAPVPDDETTDGESEEPGSEDDLRTRMATALDERDGRRIARVAGFVLVVLVTMPFVVYAVPGLVGASQSYVVLSGSMEPTIGTGDVILVEDASASEVSEGDVITYRREADTRPTTHRVVGVVEADGERAFRTKGDANGAPDQELVRPDDVEGRVPTVGGTLLAIPYVGYVVTFAGTRAGFLLLFGVPAVVLAGSEIRSFVDASSPDEQADAEEPAESDDSDDADTEESAGGGGITLSTAELLLGLVVLGAFLVYSVWVAYATLEIWAFAVAGSVGAAFLLLGSLYLFGGGADADPEEPDDADSETASDDAVDPNRIPSLETLFEGDTVPDDWLVATNTDDSEGPPSDDPDDGFGGWTDD